MKKFLLVALCFASVFAFASTVERDSVERRKAIAKTLYGRIKIVDVAEDYRVKVVNAGENLRVKIVNAGEEDVGRWKLVDVGRVDYRVKLVDSIDDLRVRFVDAGEGVAD